MVNTVALESMKAGDSAKAASTLELSLDASLLMLHALPEAESDESVRRILRRVAQYRAKHPRTSSESVGDSEISAMLSKYLNSGDEKQ
jgi:beta-glucosidase-like glycosyl hydrolase